MSRRSPAQALCIILGVLFLLAACRSAAPPGGGARADRPNVILISIDTLRADRLTPYGYAARPTSPAIGALAKDAVLFERQIAAAPWTTPSHMTLFTGLLPSAHGVTRPLEELRDALEEGYGFETLGDEHQTLPGLLSARGYRSVAFTGGSTMDPRVGFGRGFVRYHTFMRKLNEKNLARLLAAVEREQDAPFFIFWHTFEVHAPYLNGEFLDDDRLLPQGAGRLLAAQVARLGRDPQARIDAGKLQKLLERRRAFRPEVVSALYDGGVRSADRAVGRLVERLRSRRLYDDTLIVLTSDHGEQLGETAGAFSSEERDGRFYNTHGNTLHDELTHVPLIVKLPGSQHAGTRVAAVTRAIDVLPTILDIAGIAVPGAVQGRSLRALWESGSGGVRGGEGERAALSESLMGRSEAKSLRTDRYKYILSMTPQEVHRYGRPRLPPMLVTDSGAGAAELYDLRADPGERINLLARGTQRELAARYDAELRRAVAARTGRARRVPMDEGTVAELKALGYLQ